MSWWLVALGLMNVFAAFITVVFIRRAHGRGWDEGWLAGIRDGRAERDRLLRALGERETKAPLFENRERKEALAAHLRYSPVTGRPIREDKP